MKYVKITFRNCGHHCKSTVKYPTHQRDPKEWVGYPAWCSKCKSMRYVERIK